MAVVRLAATTVAEVVVKTVAEVAIEVEIAAAVNIAAALAVVHVVVPETGAAMALPRSKSKS